MKRLSYIIILLFIFSGCGGISLFKIPESPTTTSPQMATVPIIEVSPDVEKPQIKSVVIRQGDKYYIAYSVEDAMKLLEYMIKQDGQIDKLKYRIKLQNELLKKWSK